MNEWMNEWGFSPPLKKKLMVGESEPLDSHDCVGKGYLWVTGRVCYIQL